MIGWAMTKHVTIALDEEKLERARVAAEAQGVGMEDYLSRLVSDHLPIDVSESRRETLLAELIGMGSSEHPTDIAKDKDKLIGEAVWEEYLRKTRQK
jgi:hypothetical protein